MSSSISSLKKHFQLDPKFTYLNHGSFGACPYPVFNERKKWQKKLEFQPVSFIQDHAIESLEKSREALSSYIHCDKDDVVYFPNPTTAMNMVIRSLDLKAGDEVLSSNHEYGAVERTWKFVASQKGFSYKSIDIPIPFDREDFLNRLKDGINSKTKIIFLSHITSPTAIIFPIDEVCKLAKELGIMTIIDGAHAPAQIDLNLNTLGADIYTGACHKWMCTPKGVSYLYVTKSFQKFIEPLVISWGWQDKLFTESEFINWHQWQGTNDFSSYLTVPVALDFFEKNNWDIVRSKCKNLILKTKDTFDDSNTVCYPTTNNENYLGQMLSFMVNQNSSLVQNIKKNPTKILYYQAQIFEKSNIHITIIFWNNKVFVRISIQAYNSSNDVDSMFEMLDLFNLL